MSRSRAILREFVAPVAEGLERMNEILGAQIREESAAVRDMTDHVGRFQGKQLRGALVLLAGDATGNSTDEHAAVAAIVELIHLATLVHDDILDGAEVRRRVACVNQRWDNQVAVLLGDFLYARAFALSTELSSRLCSKLLAEATRRLCIGEIEQSARRYDFEMSQETYEALSGAKTATLYSAACELGARYPGGNDELGARLAAFGWNMGLAFQIVDDCLDVVGDESVVGKTLGADVEDGKVTLPVLYTYARADEALRARIRDVFTAPGIEGRAAALRAACDLGPGVEYAMARARELVDEARAKLAGLPESRALAAMETAADFVLDRNW
ncbi:MAG: polyprenyl synthetase family protein [Planctomycetota bacterium]|nr:polyprenyl synthetase family protein [Planctomycetota bacterium]